MFLILFYEINKLIQLINYLIISAVRDDAQLIDLMKLH